ncbi:MAG: hypothetical protein R3B70_01860 [Polyangiaceae bacterium]
MPDSMPRPSKIDAAWDAADSSSLADDSPTVVSDPVDMLRQAEALYEQGRLEDAWETGEAARYAFAVSDPIAETEALYLLACVAKDRGFSHVGEERIARAIQQRAELTAGAVPLSWYELHAAIAQMNGEAATAMTAWEAAVKMARATREQTGEGTERLCVALRALGDGYLSRGELDRARETFASLVVEARALVEQGADLSAFRHLTSALQRLGDACHTAEDLPATIAAYRDAVREAKRAAAALDDAPEALWDLSVGLNRLGAVQLEADQAQAAIASFEQSVDARRAILAATGRTEASLTALASSLAKLGNALAHEGETEAAATALDEAAMLDRELGGEEEEHQAMTVVPPPLR